MQHETKSVSIDILDINTENPRFETVSSQREALTVMIENQRGKLVELANDIAINGLNPSDLCMVTPQENGGKFKVLEGNRRITALKLLNNNNLIPEEHESFLNRFKGLSSDYKKNPIKNVPCVVFSNEDDANKWINLKHTGENRGIGTVRWDAQQKARFEEKVEGKTTYALQVIDLLKTDPDFDAELKSKLPQVQSSSLQRLLSDPDVRNKIGLTAKKGLIHAVYPLDEIRKPLTKIIADLASSDFTVRDIYNKWDRSDYLERFENSELPDPSASIPKWEITTPTAPRNRGPVKKRTKPRPADRNTIIPKDCAIHIESTRINKIYEELRNLDLRDFVNAASITFRVFMELSVEHFAEASAIQMHRGDKLINKISKVEGYLERNGLLTKEQLKPVRIARSNRDTIFSVDTFNAYVHNRHLSPTASDLKTVWDNLAPFILKLWESE